MRNVRSSFGKMWQDGLSVPMTDMSRGELRLTEGPLVRDSHPIISIIGEQVERITAEWSHLTEEAPPERLSEIPSVV